MTEHDEAARRSYWTSQLDEAYAFMMRVKNHPVAECGERLVPLADAARAAGVEVAFSPRPHVLGRPRIFVLRAGQINDFLKAARCLNERGWVLRVEDGFRDRAMQKGIGLQPAVFDAVLRAVTWELGGQRPEPDFLFKRLLTLAAQIPSTGMHMSGSAVDVSVLDRTTGEEVDRGGPYIEISERTPMRSPFVSPQARQNRAAITATMRENGFTEYPYEFWHYGSGDTMEGVARNTGRPARYGPVDYDAATGLVTPIENPRAPLNSLEEILAEIHTALARQCDAPAPR